MYEIYTLIKQIITLHHNNYKNYHWLLTDYLCLFWFILLIASLIYLSFIVEQFGIWKKILFKYIKKIVPQNKCKTQTTNHTREDGHVCALDPCPSVYKKPAALISCGSCGGSADGCSWSHSWVEAAGAPSSGLYDSLGEQLKDLSALSMRQATSALSSNLAHTRAFSVS